jgi:hypothetical protein
VLSQLVPLLLALVVAFVVADPLYTGNIGELEGFCSKKRSMSFKCMSTPMLALEEMAQPRVLFPSSVRRLQVSRVVLWWFFQFIAFPRTAGLNQPPSTTTWTIRLQEGVYAGPGQVGIAIRDTKRYIIWFENRAVHVQCNRAEYFLDFTGLGGRGALEVTGNGGSISDCMDSAIRSRRQTYVSSVSFQRNRALLQGSALRVYATDAAVELRIVDW